MTCVDVAVVGAGPAGALAALLLARRGRRVLLVDKARFPRDKPCGGCVQPAALDALAHAGLGDLATEPLRTLELRARGRRATLRLPGGVAVTRRTLDDALARAAARAGAEFRDGVRAAPGDRPGELRLDRGEPVAADLVLLATGLGGGVVRAGSRIGAGAVFGATAYPPGVVHMACGRGGYVGVVRAERGRTVAAAALAPDRARAGLARAAAELLEEAGLPPLPEAHWMGTPLLTRRPVRLWDERVLRLGDAAGYVEPFTGEGIAWALAAARAIAPLAAAGWRAGLGAAWEKEYRRRVRRRQRLCRAVAATLRRPALAGLLTGLLGRAPTLAAPFLRAISRPA